MGQYQSEIMCLVGHINNTSKEAEEFIKKGDLPADQRYMMAGFVLGLHTSREIVKRGDSRRMFRDVLDALPGLTEQIAKQDG